MRWLRARLRNERGSAATIFAVALVPLLGVMAIAIDVGVLYVERAQLQNGADAAAIAIAADCADSNGCSGSAAMAELFADGNALDGAAGTLTPVFSGKTVTVTDRTQNADGSGAVRHTLASLIGVSPTTVHASATAEWGNAKSGPVLPLALAYCEFAGVSMGTLSTIQYDTNKPCKGPSGQPLAGGFGWLDIAHGDCEGFIDLDTPLVGSNPGLSAPNSCSSVFADLEGKTVLIPIYDGSVGSGGQKGQLHIHSFAAFTVTGWKLTGNGNSVLNNPDPNAPPCTGNCRAIQGFFTRIVEIGGDWEIGGPDSGVVVVRLIK